MAESPTASSSAAPVRLALIQMQVRGGAKAANLARAEGFIRDAAAEGAQIALLPEALDLGWTHGSARTEAEPVPDGDTCTRLRAAAKRHGMYVCAGLTERAGDQVFNAAVLISPSGDILLHHRKLNELEIAQNLYARGDRLGVISTPLGVLGLMICADAFAPGQVVSRTLGLMGATLILSPCAWAVAADHDNLREPYGQLWLDNYGPVARDHQLWIAGCSNVGEIDDGPWQGRRCIGCSLVVGPEGAVARAPYGAAAETVIYVDVPRGAMPPPANTPGIYCPAGASSAMRR